jgi:excisionase family DNA binding protein
MSDENRITSVETLDAEQLMCTVEQAAAALGIGRTTAYELIRTRKLHAVHIGRSCRVSRAELSRFVSRMEDEQHPIRPKRSRQQPTTSTEPDQPTLF